MYCTDTKSQHQMGKIYASGYLKDEIVAAVDRVIEVLAKHRISGHAAALRWTVHHGALVADQGNAVIIAASSVAQLKSNLDFMADGPLPDEVRDVIDKIYSEVAGSEFPYHY